MYTLKFIKEHIKKLTFEYIFKCNLLSTKKIHFPISTKKKNSFKIIQRLNENHFLNLRNKAMKKKNR